MPPHSGGTVGVEDHVSADFCDEGVEFREFRDRRLREVTPNLPLLGQVCPAYVARVPHRAGVVENYGVVGVVKVFRRRCNFDVVVDAGDEFVFVVRLPTKSFDPARAREQLRGGRICVAPAHAGLAAEHSQTCGDLAGSLGPV